jgi:metal-responsive CopG/Arc/MetJ family transcriptional regulator
METKEFTQEQLDVLADMVLAEMDRLREFSNGRSEVVREALSDEVARLHTLYNYLIA